MRQSVDGTGRFQFSDRYFYPQGVITVFVELNFSTEDPVNGGGISQNERYAHDGYVCHHDQAFPRG